VGTGSPRGLSARQADSYKDVAHCPTASACFPADPWMGLWTDFHSSMGKSLESTEPGITKSDTRHRHEEALRAIPALVLARMRKHAHSGRGSESGSIADNSQFCIQK